MNILKKLQKDIDIDFDIVFYTFISWYNDISDGEFKSTINNFLVKTIDKKKVKFKLLIDKYKSNPRCDCIKEFRIALKDMLKTLLNQEENTLETITE